MRVHLTYAEIFSAALIGTMRQVNCMKRKAKQQYGANDDDNWQKNIEGAIGEMVLAKATKQFCTYGDIGVPDVGDDEVRTTQHENGRLILHPPDNDDAKFYLITGTDRDFIVRGWIMGRDGKLPEYWTDPQRTNRHAFFVPQSALTPL